MKSKILNPIIFSLWVLLIFGLGYYGRYVKYWHPFFLPIYVYPPITIALGLIVVYNSYRVIQN